MRVRVDLEVCGGEEPTDGARAGAAEGCAIMTYCGQIEGKKGTDSVLPARLPVSGQHERGHDPQKNKRIVTDRVSHSHTNIHP